MQKMVNERQITMQHMYEPNIMRKKIRKKNDIS